MPGLESSGLVCEPARALPAGTAGKARQKYQLLMEEVLQGLGIIPGFGLDAGILPSKELWRAARSPGL